MRIFLLLGPFIFCVTALAETHYSAGKRSGEHNISVACYSGSKKILGPIKAYEAKTESGESGTLLWTTIYFSKQSFDRDEFEYLITNPTCVIRRL